MRVLVACEFSGVVRDAFIARGHDAYSCDILDGEGDGPHIKDDALKHLDDGWDLMIAHPPCMHLTARGRYRATPLQREDAERFFMQLVNAPIEWIGIENPVGVMSTKYRKPDQLINPFQFGHPQRKRTCLWLKGLPLLVATENVEPEEPVHIDPSGKKRYSLDYLPESPERWKIRSRTFKGIADAMAQQWG